MDFVEPLYPNMGLIFRAFSSVALIWVQINEKALQLYVTGLKVPAMIALSNQIEE